MTKEVKQPKKIIKVIKKLHDIIDHLDFYMGHHTGFKDILKDAVEIEDILIELSVDKKVDRARLATKLKAIWKKEQEEKEKIDSEN